MADIPLAKAKLAEAKTKGRLAQAGRAEAKRLVKGAEKAEAAGDLTTAASMRAAARNILEEAGAYAQQATDANNAAKAALED